MEIATILLTVVPLLVIVWMQARASQDKEKLVQAQQDTINKLLNREPVTYAEVGQPKKTREIYSAWAGEMVDMNEEHS
jgi:hypothetical protein